MYAITGGAGFIGSMLADELNKNGINDILLVDTLGSSQKWKNIRNLEFQDIVTPEQFLSSSLNKFWKNFRCVFHLGACSSTTEMDADFLLENNYRYSQRVFEQCTLRGIPFIYASSGATYGLGPQYSDEHQDLKSLRPLNAYGYSKKIFDDWVMLQKSRPPLWFGLKFFNVYGPNEYHKGSMASVVWAAFNQIQETGKVKLFKSYREEYAHGEQQRDFIYVRDVCLGMLEFSKVTNPLKSGIYNLGTGVVRSFNDLAKATFMAMGKPVHIEYIEMPSSLRNQYQYFTKAQMNKFMHLFPQFTFSSLEEGVKDYVQNYLLKKEI